MHHLVPWEEGGPTDLHNLVLLCRRQHHVMVHEGGQTASSRLRRHVRCVRDRLRARPHQPVPGRSP
ncbi:MAG: HNH endonuclease signature motif containing protein [Acidimicrobiia bacterium]